MNAYLLVLEIARMEAGETYSSLPLHCTLVHWFWLTITPDQLTRHIESIAKSSRPLELLASHEEIFTGKTKHGLVPLTVNLINKTPELINIHMQICNKLDSLGARYMAPEYVKEGFCPHVTQSKGERLADRDIHASQAIYVIGANAPEYGNKRRIYSRIELSS